MICVILGTWMGNESLDIATEMVQYGHAEWEWVSHWMHVRFER